MITSNLLQQKDDNQSKFAPYTDAEWSSITLLANQIETEIKSCDMRLTMGGEPTFVMAKHADKKEWSTEALGQEKIVLADHLLQRLQGRFTNGGLRQYTQGKWYPHEARPRWSFNCYWRKDHQPLWKNQSLLAHHSETYIVATSTAKQMIEMIAHYLGVNQHHSMPAYEDQLFHFWQQEKLISERYWNHPSFAVSSSQQAIKNLMQADNDDVVGYVLPLHWSTTHKKWISCHWDFQSERLYLLPGSSSIGYRLPLNDLPVNQHNEYEPIPETNLFEKTEPLPSYNEYCDIVQTRSVNVSTIDFQNMIIPTALCTQIRDNKLFVFIPPITQLSLYLDLIVSIELAAMHLKTPVIIEGFTPPLDLRLQRFSITPDPGVIEVNIHPASTWHELASNYEALYEEAGNLGLSGSKFLYDGREIASGGGNHITLGGSTPSDSPFLRRPTLLQSMITFWQTHPSLSYLFSGLFIGPTCQAPRIDEARHESLYELEIAFQQLPQNETTQYWIIDRLCRHILVDISGNNHRAEFCIDKLYSPDTDFGRQGLLELRAFEMTPHWQMNSLINLLVRALATHFWQHPYKNRLIRFGTALHDQYMLPHFLSADFAEVITFLNQSGFHFDLTWFKPFFDFRFPLIGKQTVDNIELELRVALEPWSTLGSEAASQATSRKVDSALERIQVKLSGLDSEHYFITCNQVAIPLQKTEKKDEMVAGIRFKAWPHLTTLHPNIPVHSPLIFEIFDSRTRQAVGRSAYYVTSPDGKCYEKYPMSEAQALDRLHSRFCLMENLYTQLDELPELRTDPEYPYTFDLRKFL